MDDTVAMIALSVAIVSAIVGVSFYRGELWTALNRKTRHGSSAEGPVGVGGASDSAGSFFGGGDGGCA